MSGSGEEQFLEEENAEWTAERNKALAGLRRKFAVEYESNEAWKGKFCESDLIRLKTQNWWIDKFLDHYDNDLDVAFPVFIEALKWRHDFQVEYISLLSLKPYLERQVMYIHGVDKEQQSLLWFNCCHHKRGDPIAQKLIAYWLERHVMETSAKPLVIVFDMTLSGLQNMDLDVVRFLLHCLKFYYPGVLAYLLVFDIPFILNAAWRLIKSWLEPAAQKMIIFVGKTSIDQYIDKANRPKHMAGTDTFIFTMDTIAGSVRSAEKELTTNSDVIIEDGYVRPIDSEMDPFPRRRNVMFDDEIDRKKTVSVSLPTPPVSPKQSNKEMIDNERDGNVRAKGNDVQQLTKKVRQIVDSRLDSHDDWFCNHFIAINPKEEVTLRAVAGETDAMDVLLVRNCGEKSLAYKIKTTAPEKFRVRPSTAIVRPGHLSVVRLFLQSGYQQTTSREKFLILAMEIEDAVSLDCSSQLFNNVDQDSLFEHRLRCKVDHLVSSVNLKTMTNGSLKQGSLVEVDQNQRIAEISVTVKQLQHETRLLMLLILMALFLSLAILFCQNAMSDQLQAFLRHPPSSAKVDL